MNFYFNGDSWTNGAELENQEKERFSKLICDHYGVEEINLAFSGKSNDAIIREIYLDQPCPDIAFVQLTFPLRTEYYDDWCEKWRTININPSYRTWNIEKTKQLVRDSLPRRVKRGNHFKNSEEFLVFWEFYYTNLVSVPYLEMKEKMQLEIVKAYFRSKNIPLVLTTINNYTKHGDDFDLNLSKRSYPHAPMGHPNKEGHLMIKDDLLNIIKSRGYCNV